MRRKQKRKRKLRPGTFLFFLLLAMLLAAVIYAGNQFREEVGQMAEYRSKIAAVKMVNDSIEAYVKRDLALANAVIDYDDVVDEAFMRVKNTLISMLTASAADGEYAIDLLMIAKYFERIGDHAVNIAEWVEFSVTGEHKSDSMQ